jgi:hypothetical protein
MIPAKAINKLKPYIEQAILYGDFLVSTNTFSHVWISNLKTEEARTLERETLTGFWLRYLEKNTGNYLLVSIKQFEETSNNILSANTLIKEAVELINNPRLRFKKVLVDPDSFEIFIEEDLRDSTVMIFVDLSVPHDLLLAVCKNLRALGYMIKGIIIPVENAQSTRADISNYLQVELIPFIVYNKQEDKFYTIMEMKEEPYTHYHCYFSP